MNKVEYIKCKTCNVIKTEDLDEVFIDPRGEVCIRDASVAEFLICQLYRRVETEVTINDELTAIISSMVWDEIPSEDMANKLLASFNITSKD